MKRIGLFLATLVALTGVAHADVYKYIDADGTVTFTDDPPADVKSELVDLQPFNPPSTPTPIGVHRRSSVQAQVFGEVEVKRIDGLVQEQVSANERRCTEARVALEVLRQAMPVYWVRNSEYRAAWAGDTHVGHREYLGEEQRQSAIDNEYQALVNNCAEPFSEERQEQAHSDWYNAEHCKSAREDLEMILQPGSRTPDDAVEQKQKIVDQYCSV